jgi:hypothetical protein
MEAFEKQLEKLEHLVSRQASWTEVEEQVRMLLATSPANAGGSALASFAVTARGLAAAIEELENRCESSNVDLAQLADEIRLRLLRLEWLARKYNDFRQNESLPAELELSSSHGSLDKLPHNFSKAIESSFKYWHAPKEYLEFSLDDVVSRDVLTLIQHCDSVANNEHFNDILPKVLEVAQLEDISPRAGEPYDPEQHMAVDFEEGDPGAIIRIKSRGFCYKKQRLNKPEVIVGINHD